MSRFFKCEVGLTFCTPMIDTVTMWLETKDALSNRKLVSLFVPSGDEKWSIQ
jgi:hypothetical protein